MPAPSLAFVDVTKRYAATAAVDAVGVEIAAGQFVALVGQSGSGKSTLLKTVNRLVTADSGRVLIDGEDVAAGPAPDLRRRVGYVFQGRRPVPAHDGGREHRYRAPHRRA